MWWIWLIVLFVVVLPLIVNEVYKAGLSSDKAYVTMFGASDVIAYIGAISGTVGTVVLGVVAYMQNERMHELNERITMFQKRNPLGYLLIVEDHCFVDSKGNKTPIFEYDLKEPIPFANKSHSDLIIKNMEFIFNDETRQNFSSNEFYPNINGIYNILRFELGLRNKDFENEIIEMKFVFDLENSNRYPYKEIISLKFKKEESSFYKLDWFNIIFEEEN